MRTDKEALQDLKAVFGCEKESLERRMSIMRAHFERAREKALATQKMLSDALARRIRDIEMEHGEFATDPECRGCREIKHLRFLVELVDTGVGRLQGRVFLSLHDRTQAFYARYDAPASVRAFGSCDVKLPAGTQWTVNDTDADEDTVEIRVSHPVLGDYFFGEATVTPLELAAEFVEVTPDLLLPA